MKYILNILFVVAILMVSCKKQEIIEKTNADSTFEMKSGSSSTPSGDVKDDGGIIETEDEDDKKKKGPKGTNSSK
jgi:hypothetical protein